MTMSNMHIWNLVAETNPAHTKPVKFGKRSFTTIDAHYQIRQATEVFGPVGIGWGYLVSHSTMAAGTALLAVADVTLWHGSQENTYGPFRGMAKIIDADYRLDDDAAKKAMTDALTKGLSHLGFNADVFLGLFDDNKYVKRMQEKFEEPEDSQIDGATQGVIDGMLSALADRQLSEEWLISQAAQDGWKDATLKGIAQSEDWRNWARNIIKTQNKKEPA